MKTDVIQDLAILTTIPTATLQKLFNKIQYIICHTVEESNLSGEDTTEVDLDIGTLVIKVEDGALKFRFVPSVKLNKNIKSTIINDKSPLTSEVEAVLKDRITKTYKELF